MTGAKNTPPIIGAPVDWDKLDDAERRKLVAEAAQWAADRPDCPPGHAEALEKLASALDSLEHRPKDKPVSWLMPLGQKGQRLSPGDDMRRARLVGTVRYYEKQGEHGALTRARKLLCKVRAPGIPSDPTECKRWEKAAKEHSQAEVREAYSEAVEGVYAADLPAEAFTVAGENLFKKRLCEIAAGSPVTLDRMPAAIGKLPPNLRGKLRCRCPKAAP